LRIRAPVLTVPLVAALALPGGGAPLLAHGGYEGGGYGGGYGGTGSGQVELKLKGKKKQRSEKAVKVKATCGPRACLLDARGRLTSPEGNGHLKPKHDIPIDARQTRKVKLKLNRKGKRAASAADKSKVLVKGKAIGSGGGGGKDKARKRIRLKS